MIGVASLSVVVILVLVGLDRGTAVGFTDPVVVAMMAVGILLLVAFAVIEARKGDDALVPRRVMKSRQFASAVLSVTLMSATFFHPRLRHPLPSAAAPAPPSTRLIRPAVDPHIKWAGL